MERLVIFALFKAAHCTLVVSQEVVEIAVWTAWFAVLRFLIRFAVLG